ncbi:MAG: SCP2 sterol-binding domain-containing protein [Acidimicrobiales bacterium]
MADFLGAAWFEALNETLGRASAAPIGDREILRVVFEFVDGPSSSPHAMTFTVGPEGAVAEPGDHLAADAVVSLSYDDAVALTSGTLESAVALREGRLKVRGDVQVLVPLIEWMLESHAG